MQASNQCAKNQSEKRPTLLTTVKPAQMAGAAPAYRHLPAEILEPSPLLGGNTQRDAAVGFGKTANLEYATGRIEKSMPKGALNFGFAVGRSDFMLAEFTKYMFFFMLLL